MRYLFLLAAVPLVACSDETTGSAFDGLGGMPSCTTSGALPDAGHTKGDGSVLYTCIDDAGFGYVCDGG